MNEFVYTPVLTVCTILAAYAYALVDGGDPGRLEGLTLWSLAPPSKGSKGAQGGSGSSGSDTQERLLGQVHGQEEMAADVRRHEGL